MGSFGGYSVVACNTATASTNKIHDDDVARRFGFRGGLVPGVDVFAYLTHPPVATWGLDWLCHGTMRARFHEPVYDGELVQVVAVGNGDLELRNDRGHTCATATAALPTEPPPLPDPASWPEVERAAAPPAASSEVLEPGTALGLAPRRFHAERALEYLAAIHETLGVYEDEGVAHPGFVLRDANNVLSGNVRLGPWIHVESEVQFHGLVHDAEPLGARALVTAEWEAKGHRFVTLDVLHLSGDRPVARTTHTAIYQPRGAAVA